MRPHGSPPVRQLMLALPCIVIILACTAVPMELRPSAEAFAEFIDFRLDGPDILENMIGYLPLGAVLHTRGAWTGIGFALALSLFAETTQVFSKGRSPSFVDVAANVIGAAISLAVFTRWKVVPAKIALGRRPAFIAATVAATYVALGAPVSTGAIEKTFTMIAAAPSWIAANERISTDPGKLEAHWTFDSIANDVVHDDSRNGLDALLVNRPQLVVGVDGHALAFNGADQWMIIGDPPALRITGSMTITAWINARAFPRDDAAILSNYGGLGYQLDITKDRGPREVGFKLTNTFGRRMIRYGRTTISTNRWYHVAGVYDAAGPSLNVYVDGRPDNGCFVGRISSRQYISGSDVYVGRRGGGGYGFIGAIDDVRVYSRALTDGEIAAQVDAIARTPSHPNSKAALDSECSRGEPADARIAGVLVALGMVVAVACVGLWPSPRFAVPCLLLSALTGVLVLPSIEQVVPQFFALGIPLLTLAGGATVLASVRSETIPRS
jgi:Concanavalin A-like lectin/glucanases superfamily/VanZ like family